MQEDEAEEEYTDHHAEGWRVVWGGWQNESFILKEMKTIEHPQHQTEAFPYKFLLVLSLDTMNYINYKAIGNNQL